jgi:hypothetical protein
MKWLWLFTAVLFLPPTRAEEVSAKKEDVQIRQRFALVIGNSRYENAPALPNALNDARDMCETLTKMHFDSVCKFDIASKRELKDVIYEFTGKLGKDSAAVFYFAGHGVEIEGTNYVIPTRAALRTKSDIDDESVQLNYILREFGARHAALNVFILDACRDNPFLNPMRDYVPRLGFATQMDIPENTVLAVSTGANQVSLDGAGANGTFTRNVLGSFRNSRETIEDAIRTAMMNTSADARRVGKRQEPVVTSSFHGRFCLAGCPGDVLPDAAAKREEEAIVRKREELARLDKSIAEARAKQAEIEKEKQALLEKQIEVEKARASLREAEARQEAAVNERQALIAKEREAESITKNINDAAARLSELENTRNALLARQQEVARLREQVEAQERSVRSRPATGNAQAAGERKHRYEPAIMPAF